MSGALGIVVLGAPIPIGGGIVIANLANRHMHFPSSGMQYDGLERIDTWTSSGSASSGSRDWDLEQAVDATKPVYVASGVGSQPSAQFAGDDYIALLTQSIMGRKEVQMRGDAGSGVEDIYTDIGNPSADAMLTVVPLIGCTVFIPWRSASSFTGDMALFAVGSTELSDEFLWLGTDSDGRFVHESSDGGTVHRVRGNTVLTEDADYLAMIHMPGSGNGGIEMTINDTEQTISVVSGSDSGKCPGDLTCNVTSLGALYTSAGVSKHVVGMIGAAITGGLLGISSRTQEAAILAYLRTLYGV